MLEPPDDVRFDIRGVLGERLQANIRNWLLVAPDANPGMLEVFRDRDRLPRRDLLPWAGEFPGKYLTSAVKALQLAHDPALEAHLRRFVPALIAAQDADGYLGPFPQAARLMEPGLWDIWGHYHCMLGLYLWHLETGDQAALDACLRAADLLCRIFLDGDKRVVQAGSEEMNESVIHILCLLHRHTGQRRYLQLAREIEKDWEVPPSGDYVRQALAGKEFYEGPKPRWEGLHGIQAIAELHYITGEDQYRRAYEHIWWSIARGDRHNTGGFSSGEQATGNPYDPRAIETCCTIAWMALTVDMLRLTGNPLVADELELSTFNAVLGAQNPSGRWWTYNTPMDGDRKASAHEIVFQARAGAPELNCCSVNGPRGLGMLADWALMASDEGLFLNYYGPCQLSARIPRMHQAVRLDQETDYPRSNRIRLTVTPEARLPFALNLRIPRWSARTQVSVAGSPLPAPPPGEYLKIERQWQPGDVVEIALDFAPHAWVGERECEGKASIYRGPILLAYDPRFDRYGADQVPVLDLSRLALSEMDWTTPPSPLLLAQVISAEGQPVTLCDFASAGLGGTRYISWLPARGLPPSPFTRDNPLRTKQV